MFSFSGITLEISGSDFAMTLLVLVATIAVSFHFEQPFIMWLGFSATTLYVSLRAWNAMPKHGEAVE